MNDMYDESTHAGDVLEDIKVNVELLRLAGMSDFWEFSGEQINQFAWQLSRQLNVLERALHNFPDRDVLANSPVNPKEVVSQVTGGEA